MWNGRDQTERFLKDSNDGILNVVEILIISIDNSQIQMISTKFSQWHYLSKYLVSNQHIWKDE
jgi:hypothetical protein